MKIQAAVEKDERLIAERGPTNDLSGESAWKPALQIISPSPDSCF